MNAKDTAKEPQDIGNRQAAGAAQRPQDASEGGKRPVGRPLKFASAEVLQKAIDAYFAQCDKGREAETVSQGRVVKYTERIPYTVTGLCIVLDCERSTLIDYGDGKYDETDPEFSNTVKKAKRKVLDQIEHNLYNGKPAAGAIFSLKNNNGWRDRTEWEGELSGSLQVETVNYANAVPDLRGKPSVSESDDQS